jgi:NitT/TauT family transport system substrate-binding protein
MRVGPAGITPRNSRRRPSSARLLLAVASGLAVLAAAGCSASSGAGGSVSETITIAAVPGIDDAPLYLAQQEGLFAAAGLQHVVIKSESQEGAEFSALQNNQAQIAATDYGNIFYEQSLGHRYRILADGYDATTGTLEVLTLPNSNITSPADLAGKKVGLPSDDILPHAKGTPPDSLEAAAADEVLQSYANIMGNPVDWDAMTQQDEVTALIDHSVQAILVGQPYIFEAEKDAGAVEVMDACSGSTQNLPLSGYVATSSWVSKNPTAAADFQSAMAKAQADASMAGPLQTVLEKDVKMKVQEADLSTTGTYPTATSVTELSRVERLLWIASLIRSTPSVSRMIVR